MWVHVRRGNAVGVRAQAAKALAELTPYLPGYLGLDVGAIVRDIHRLAGATTDTGRSEIEPSLKDMSPPRLEFRAAHLRGDEPEICAST